jgi:hypothetical protein
MGRGDADVSFNECELARLMSRLISAVEIVVDFGPISPVE